MIVTTSIRGLHIIFQEAHGLLAGKIAIEIATEFRPINWFETLIAVCEHDDRQLGFQQKNYFSEIGVPLDFTEEKENINDILKRMQRILNSAEKKSLWIKLLISYHLEFIYSHLKKTSKRIDRFFKNEEMDRRDLLKLFNISDEKARDYYEFLRFCDRLSLILCKEEAPDDDRLLEINTSINGETYFIKKTENNDLTIIPWIFKSSKFELMIEQRILKETQFNSASKFESALLNSEMEFKKWTLVNLENQ